MVAALWRFNPVKGEFGNRVGALAPSHGPTGGLRGAGLGVVFASRRFHSLCQRMNSTTTLPECAKSISEQVRHIVPTGITERQHSG